MELQEALKILRKELGITQNQLAQALHLNCSTVNRWENGRAVPNHSTANYIMDYAKEQEISTECEEILSRALFDSHKEDINSAKSMLYSVERETICQLVDDMETAVFVSDIETNELLYVNHQAEVYVGKVFETGKKVRCHKFCFDYDDQCVFCQKDRLTLREYVNRIFVSPKTGDTYRLSCKKVDWNGRPAQVEYFYNETDKLNREEGMKDLLERLEIGISSVYAYADGRVELSYLNEGFYRMMGESREERLQYSGLHAMDAILKEDVDRIRKAIDNACENCQSIKENFRIVDKNKGSRWINLKAEFIRQTADMTIFYCVFTDIDEFMV